jgi:hypothetical protein
MKWKKKLLAEHLYQKPSKVHDEIEYNNNNNNNNIAFCPKQVGVG